MLAQPQADWRSNTVITGAVPFDASRGAIPQDLERFLDSGPPPAVFTLGSAAVAVKKAPRFYETGAAAAAALGLRAVLLVGPGPAIRPAISSPDVLVTEWAPHSELFPRASVVVHQGGAGTLHTALAAGKPMIIVPQAHDQPDNAVRTERLGFARVVYPGQFTAARVRTELESLLSDSAVADHANQVSARVRMENGGAAGAAAIERAFTRRSAIEPGPSHGLTGL